MLTECLQASDGKRRLVVPFKARTPLFFLLILAPHCLTVLLILHLSALPFLWLNFLLRLTGKLHRLRLRFDGAKPALPLGQAWQSVARQTILTAAEASDDDLVRIFYHNLKPASSSENNFALRQLLPKCFNPETSKVYNCLEWHVALVTVLVIVHPDGKRAGLGGHERRAMEECVPLPHALPHSGQASLQDALANLSQRHLHQSPAGSNPASFWHSKGVGHLSKSASPCQT